MCHGVNGEVLPYRWSGDLRAPAEGEVDGGEAYCKVPGRVLGPKGGEGGEGLWESGRGRAGLRGGAGNSEGSKAPPVSAVGDNGGEEAAGNAMAEEGSDACPWGGEAFDEGEDSLGQGKPVPVVVGRVEGGGEPISQPSDHWGWPEEVAF